MSSDHLEKVVTAVQHSTAAVDPEHLADSSPATELHIAVASAISRGEPRTVIAAIADLPSLAVLDAIDALQPGQPV